MHTLTGTCVRGRRFEKESEISPNSGAPMSTAHNFVSSGGSPIDQRSAGGFRNYRRDLSVLDTSGGSVPSFSRNPPTSTNMNGPRRQWAPYNNPVVMPSSAFPGSFDESNENLPPFRPGTGRTAASDSPDIGYYGDGSERRPSIASATTVSSTGSKSSVNKTFPKSKKLQGFFGEDFVGRDSRRGSATSLQPHSNRRRDASSHSQRDRNNSQSTTYAGEGRTASPNNSRPRTPTPAPSSDVVPFLYQDFQVSPCA